LRGEQFDHRFRLGRNGRFEMEFLGRLADLPVMDDGAGAIRQRGAQRLILLRLARQHAGDDLNALCLHEAAEHDGDDVGFWHAVGDLRLVSAGFVETPRLFVQGMRRRRQRQHRCECRKRDTHVFPPAVRIGVEIE